ncbi:uncharacterized protein [Arachis hypogaea]|uniref:uncharacterized protein isoform X2 n=1 Tax=Arachis hypogaea TaxID=3818 RepID=UPI000DED294B
MEEKDEQQLDEGPAKSAISHEKVTMLHDNLFSEEAVTRLVKSVVLENLQELSATIIGLGQKQPLQQSLCPTPTIPVEIPHEMDTTHSSGPVSTNQRKRPTRRYSIKKALFDISNDCPQFGEESDYEYTDSLKQCNDNSILRLRKRKNYSWVKKGVKAQNKHIKRKLFVSEDTKLDRSRPWLYHSHISPYMDGEEMPLCLDLNFRPAKGMMFIGAELAMVAYIFGSGLDPNEILVPNDHCEGTRKIFLTLVPGSKVIGDVLTLVASMMSKGTHGPVPGKLGIKWWLPPTFAQIAMHHTNISAGTIDYIRSTYTGFADNLLMIYVPIHIDDHWFLMVVDRFYEKVSYMDSLKCENLLPSRMDAMEAVAKLLDNILSKESLYKLPNAKTKSITLYDFDEPKVPQQKMDSNDCGVFVAQWMILSNLWKPLENQVVNDYTRMRIALDLVMQGCNPLVEEMKKLAITNWDSKMTNAVLHS